MSNDADKEDKEEKVNLNYLCFKLVSKNLW